MQAAERLCAAGQRDIERLGLELRFEFGIGQCLPAHGQRTRTNARTRKGPRKGAIAKKKTV